MKVIGATPGKHPPLGLLIVFGFTTLVIFFFVGTGLRRAPQHDYRPEAKGERCLVDRPVGYDCFLPRLCRRPESCIQGSGVSSFCCRKTEPVSGQD
jgi:hypothetical protein